MDIDILFSENGEAGLIATDNFVKKLAGVTADFSTGFLTLEYNDSDHLDMNIPLDYDHHGTLDHNTHIHVGAVKNGHIGQAYQVPLMIADDPYRGELLGSVSVPSTPLRAFETFIRKAISGQPLHREDLSNDDTSGCILGDAVPSSLEFAPQLARRQALEATPRAPSPRGPGPSAPGLGGGGGIGGGSYGSSNSGNQSGDN